MWNTSEMRNNTRWRRRVTIELLMRANASCCPRVPDAEWVRQRRMTMEFLIQAHMSCAHNSLAIYMIASHIPVASFHGLKTKIKRSHQVKK